jgi:hypothetical protein
VITPSEEDEMAKTDEVRADIEKVRGDLSSTLEEIGERVTPKKVVGRAKAEVADKVSPARAVRRRGQRLREGLRVAKDSVRGGDDGADAEDDAFDERGATMPTSATRRAGGGARLDAGSDSPTPSRSGSGRVSTRGGGAVADVASRARSAPRAVQDRAEGNPLAAGLVAFGAGVAVAMILPPSEPERRALGQARQRIDPLKQRVVETGRSVAGELQPVAQAGVERVKDRAATAAQQIKDQAQGVAQEVKGQAQEAAQEVKGQAQGAAQQVKGTARSSTQEVTGEAKGVARQVKAQARGATKAAKSETTGSAKATAGQAKAAPRRTKAAASGAAAKAAPRPRRAKAASGGTRAGSGASGPTTGAPE